MEKYKIGALLGRFEPPHFGHIYMIDYAASFCDELYVLVYTLPSESISGKTRYKALKDHYKNHFNDFNYKIRIKWIEKQMPQKPEDHPDFWNIWKNDIQEQISKKIECFFGSENYVKNLGDILNCDHKIIDLNREVVPISGTLCREKTIESWDYIIPEIKPDIVKKICFVGGESTGKSTMARMMSKIFKTQWVPEFGREYCEIKPPSQFTTEDFFIIAKAQLHKEKAMLKNANRYLFCDTDPIVTQVFHKLYLGYYSDKLNECIKKSHYDLYFLLAPTFKFVQDGTREFEHLQKEHFNLLKEVLNLNKRKYTEVHEPDFDKRIKLIKFEIIRNFELKNDQNFRNTFPAE